ncbi:MAG: preprotein translocase subunit SecG [Patescibacteria group bacterium]|nr:preprotein translocase subunit SecG [Patescibacteria group bacterium]
MNKVITIIQVVTLILIIGAVLLQQKGSGLSAVFGGSTGFYKTKRGAEKFLFWLTVVAAFIFFLTSIWQLAS